jgi:hypothetical protein
MIVIIFMVYLSINMFISVLANEMGVLEDSRRVAHIRTLEIYGQYEKSWECT